MDTIRRDFIEKLEKELGTKILGISWIYGKGEAIADDEDSPIFYCDCALQVLIERRGEKGYISYEGVSYCEDTNNILGTLLGEFEAWNSNVIGLTSNYDIDKVMSLMSEYFYTFSSELDKPVKDWVYYESI
mgnify:CR=1 FL=1